jgi:Fe-S oxidoreductase
LCGSFPTLFDLVDESKTQEVNGVDKKDYWKVVDQCYLCDLCYMTKCPYVPPHQFNLDFPHTMLRAKAIKFKKGEVSTAEKFLASTDVHGQLAGIPIVVQVANAVNQTKLARSVMESLAGVDRDAWLPSLASKKFRNGTPMAKATIVTEGEKTPGKIAIFATCFINYNEPGIGLDLLKILDHNDLPYVIVEKEKCCGMPKLELGDLESVARLKLVNIPPLARLAREGYAILTAVPSCTLMFKSELPLLFPGDAEVEAVSAAMFDPFEYLVQRHKDGLLKTDFKQPLGKVSYHIPCHSRVQNMGQKTREALQLVPQTTVNTVERCSGHDGTWGVKSEYYANSMKIGRPVFKAMAASDPDYISSDCAIAARHIEQGMGKTRAQREHPITLMRIAYGL